MNNMKKLRKVLALILAMVMVLGMSTTAFADGTDGKITLTNASAGQDYNLYKILDATYDAVNDATSYYTTNATFAADKTTPFTFTSTPDSQGRYYVVGDAPTVAKVKAWATKDPVPSYVQKIGATKNITSGNTIKWDGLAYGYYYITSGLGSVVTIDSANKTASVIDKNDTTPHTDDEDGAKKIVDGAEETTLATAAIGDTVNFKVSFTATNFVTKDEKTKQVTHYQIVDTPTNLSNLAIDSITVGDKTLTVGDYTVSGQMTINIPWVDKDGASLYTSPIAVTINYHATLDAVNASNDVVISNDGTNETIPGHTDIVTATLTINKVDGDDNPLDGAWFALQKSDGTNVILTKIADGQYTVAKENGISFKGDSADNYIVAGTTTIVGLDGNDTYTLVEKKAPVGYNMAENIPNVTFMKSTSSDKDDDGNTTTTTTYTATSKVINQSGTTLPSTGGIGTTIFYIIGAILVIGAGVVLVTRRRMNAN